MNAGGPPSHDIILGWEWSGADGGGSDSRPTRHKMSLVSFKVQHSLNTATVSGFKLVEDPMRLISAPPCMT